VDAAFCLEILHNDRGTLSLIANQSVSPRAAPLHWARLHRSQSFARSGRLRSVAIPDRFAFDHRSRQRSQSQIVTMMKAAPECNGAAQRGNGLFAIIDSVPRSLCRSFQTKCRRPTDTRKVTTSLRTRFCQSMRADTARRTAAGDWITRLALNSYSSIRIASNQRVIRSLKEIRAFAPYGPEWAVSVHEIKRIIRVIHQPAGRRRR